MASLPRALLHVRAAVHRVRHGDGVHVSMGGRDPRPRLLRVCRDRLLPHGARTGDRLRLAGRRARVVLTPARSALVPALVVPDEQTWTVFGADPAAFGARPSFDPGTIRRLLAPAQVPAELAAALRAYRTALADDVPVAYGDVAFGSEVTLSTLLEPSTHGEHGHGHGEHDHGEHGHGG